jgi:hypothetical protein
MDAILAVARIAPVIYSVRLMKLNKTNINGLLEIGKTIEFEFNDIIDYVWKSDDLIKIEKHIEISKCKEYFSNNSELKELRWEMENYKISTVFSYLLTISNLFVVMSVFETRLYLLSKHMENITGIKITKNKYKMGLNVIIDYFQQGLKVKYRSINLWEQINAAIKLRNFFMHANGFLNHARNAQDIINIINSKLYLSEKHRGIKGEYDIKIIKNKLYGDKVILPNRYTFILTYYIREYLKSIIETITGETVINILQWPEGKK